MLYYIAIINQYFASDTLSLFYENVFYFSEKRKIENTNTHNIHLLFYRCGTIRMNTEMRGSENIGKYHKARLHVIFTRRIYLQYFSHLFPHILIT